MSEGYWVGVVVALWAILMASGNKNVRQWFREQFQGGQGAARPSGVRPGGGTGARPAASAPRPTPLPYDPGAGEAVNQPEEQLPDTQPWFVPEWGGKCYEDDVFEVFLIDLQGRTIRLPEFKEISLPAEGLVVLDRVLCHSYDGQQLFDSRKAKRPFRFATTFREGMALVSDSGKTRYGFVTRQDFTMTVPISFHEARDFQDGRAVVRQESRWGFVTREGEFRALPSDADPQPCRDFREGLAAAASRGKWGFIDGTGQWAIPPRFDWAGSFAEGKAAVREGGKYRYIGPSGETVIGGPFACARRFAEGIAPVALAPGKGWGLIDGSGELVVGPAWHSVEACGDGVVPFTVVVRRGQIPQAGLYTVRSKESRMVEGCTRIRPFAEGTAVAEIPGRTFAHLNTRGEWVGARDSRWSKVSPFRGGVAICESRHL